MLLVATVEVGAIFALHGGGLPPAAAAGCAPCALEIARTLLWIYCYAIFLYALLSLIAPGGYSPLQSVLATLCEPVLRPDPAHHSGGRGTRSVAAVGGTRSSRRC